MLGSKRRQALLVLEDGSTYRGVCLCRRRRGVGEVVFNTGMTGYQEILTDPSYNGQIVTMTYPLIGNYGINAEDMESTASISKASSSRSMQESPSNWRSPRL